MDYELHACEHFQINAFYKRILIFNKAVNLIGYFDYFGRKIQWIKPIDRVIFVEFDGEIHHFLMRVDFEFWLFMDSVSSIEKTTIKWDFKGLIFKGLYSLMDKGKDLLIQALQKNVVTNRALPSLRVRCSFETSQSEYQYSDYTLAGSKSPQPIARLLLV